jgi:hypothetical protein
MMAADPLGHLAHGMAQNTPEPTFGGKSLDEVVKGLEQEAKTKSKGGRPRKA